jgi:hypothetical protein
MNADIKELDDYKELIIDGVDFNIDDLFDVEP